MTHEVVTWEEAERLMRAAEAAFSHADVAGILDMFTDDVVARYAGLPDVVGREQLEQLLRARFERQLGYKVTKTLLVVSGTVIVDSWQGAWTDSVTGDRMQGAGMECLHMRSGRVAKLDAVFHGWKDDEPERHQII